MAFVAGKNSPVTWSPASAGGVYTTLDITGHDWEEAIDKIDITSTSHIGIQAILVGILRGVGNVRLKHKNTINPPSTLGVYAGASGIMRFYLTSTNYFQVPCTILKVPYKSEVAGAVEYSISVELNAEAGTYTQALN